MTGMHMLALSLAIAAMLAAQNAQAQIYRSVMPDGRIVYGDKAVQGARDAREVELRPPNIAVPGPVSRPQTAQPGMPSKSASLDSAQEAVVKATEELDRARAARESGVEAREGDSMGSAVSGRVRRTEAYEQRQKQLEDAVKQAERRLDEALTRRNAAR